MAVKRRGDPTISQMNDIQLLSHLLTMAGAELHHARESAHVLLDRHQSLERVLALPRSLLLEQPGLNENESVFLLLLSALMKRYSAPVATQRVDLDDPKAIRQLLLPQFQGYTTERVCAFCLDGELNLLSSVLVAQGGAEAVFCSTLRVLELALDHHAHAVILAHNHPDGTAEFSKSDLLSTSSLFQALSLLDIPLLDHYLLAGDQVISLRALVSERGLPTHSIPLPGAWYPPET